VAAPLVLEVIRMATMNLDKSYRFKGVAYGPGDGVEVPDEAAKKIRAFQKEHEDAGKTTKKADDGEK
jgi:hypothetical protein